MTQFHDEFRKHSDISGINIRTMNALWNNADADSRDYDGKSFASFLIENFLNLSESEKRNISGLGEGGIAQLMQSLNKNHRPIKTINQSFQDIENKLDKILNIISKKGYNL